MGIERHLIARQLGLEPVFPETFKKNNKRNESDIQDLIENHPALYRYLTGLENENSKLLYPGSPFPYKFGESENE